MNQKPSILNKTTSLFVGLSLLVSFAFIFPSVHATTQTGWQTTFRANGITPTVGSFGFGGACHFIGVTSGTNGNCQFSTHFNPRGQGAFGCAISFDVTSWSILPSQPPPVGSGFPNDFYINSINHVIVNPPSQSCFDQIPPVPEDTAIPGAAGHYNLVGILLSLGLIGEYQVQVTQLFK